LIGLYFSFYISPLGQRSSIRVRSTILGLFFFYSSLPPFYLQKPLPYSLFSLKETNWRRQQTIRPGQTKGRQVFFLIAHRTLHVYTLRRRSQLCRPPSHFFIHFRTSFTLARRIHWNQMSAFFLSLLYPPSRFNTTHSPQIVSL